MTTTRIALALIGWALIIGHTSEAHAEPKPKGNHGAVKTWPIRYTTNVARSDVAAGTCEVIIMTDGHEWPRPVTNYIAFATDAKCDPSGLAIHDSVTRNNAGPDQR